MGGSGLKTDPGKPDPYGRSADLASATTNLTPAQQGLNQYVADANSPGMQSILNKYGSGQISLQDALSQSGSAGQRAALATDPLTGSRMAASEVQSNPLTSGLFGKGGIQDQSQAQYGNLNQEREADRGLLSEDRNALLGRDQSYGLNSNDLAAYGQASGSISRMFANQGQGLAQQLADRGLAAAPSGAAVQGYSNLYGNQQEQLAGLQQQIAQNRIQEAQKLAQARTLADLQQQGLTNQAIGQNNQLMQGLGGLGQEALQNQYGRQLSGAENSYNQMAGAAGMGMQNQALQQNINNANFAQQQATHTPTLGEALSNGFISGAGSSASQIAASPGTGATSFAQSFGKGLGGLGGM